MGEQAICVASADVTTPELAAALEHLTSDLAEALPVYARIAGTEAPTLARSRAGADVARAGTVLLALALENGAPPLEGPPASWAPAGARVYALVTTAGDPQLAAAALAELRELCELRGQAWMGGLAVGDAATVARFSRGPRMGWARRRVSEALDQLAWALLAGAPCDEQLVRPSLAARLAAHVLPSQRA